MDIKQKFHSFCEGCGFLRVETIETTYLKGESELLVSCANFDICARVYDLSSAIYKSSPKL